MVTGPVFAAKKLKTIGNGVIVPTAVYKAIYMPKTGAIGAYYAPNDNSPRSALSVSAIWKSNLALTYFLS